MNTTRFITQGFSLLLVIPILMSRSGAATQTDPHNASNSPTITATLLGISKTEDRLTLLIAGQTAPISVPIDGNTIIGGTCHDCHQLQQFKASAAAKICTECNCESSNAECLAWQPIPQNTWRALLNALPFGTVLHLTLNQPNNPSSGLRSLLIDRHTILLPIAGQTGITPEQLLQIVKPFGGVKVEPLASGQQWLIHLKGFWTSEQASKLKKALSDVGLKLAFPTNADSTQSKN
jgi:hypothetical protein